MSGQQQTLTDQLREFYGRYYEDEIAKLAQRYPGDQRSLTVDYDDLFVYDRDLAMDAVEQPDQIREYMEEALQTYDLPADVSLTGANVRLTNLSESRQCSIGQYNASHSLDNQLGQLLDIRGQVIEQSDEKPLITEAAFECGHCGVVQHIPQTSLSLQEPHECHGCERQGPFTLNTDQSSYVDFQRIRLQKPPEEAQDGQTTFDINLRDDLTQSVKTGNRVTVTSELHGELENSGKEKQATMELYGKAQSIQTEDSEWNDANIRKHMDRIEEIADSDNTFEKVAQSIKRSHQGHDDIKLALALQMFQGVWKTLPDGSTIRGTVHVLLIGDPGVDKSGLLNYAKDITPGAIYTDGSGSTKAGLTATAVQSDLDGGGWVIRGGSLVKANNSLAAIDELDDMEEEDRGGMKESMASGTISVSKGDNNVTLPAQTSVLAAANPKYGRYDDYQPIAEQIDFDPALLSRFDLIFPMTDDVDPESDRDLANHLNDMTEVGQKREAGMELTGAEKAKADPPIDKEVMRAYVAYARENVNPVLTPEAKKYIADNYVSVRTKGEDDEDSPVPTTARTVLALHRLAEASARIRLSEEITIKDAERVVDIWKTCMQKIGVDPETGEFDADVVETGESKSQRDEKKSLKAILQCYWNDPEYDYGAPIEEYLADAEGADIDEDNARAYLQELIDKRDAYEPKEGYIDDL